MATINTNVHALFSQTALKSTERSQQVSMQQLSSGTRINSSRDDAAGLSITSRMTPQIHSVNQAVRNAGDAINLIQTAEGATNEISDMLHRMRELAVQAANDTHSNEQRGYLDLEFQQLKKQIVQIADTTEWNGFPVLNGKTGERVGIKPVYKTTSEPSLGNSIQFTAAKPSSSSSSIRTGGASGLVTGVTEESVLTFPAMSKGQTITVAGLTYTATVSNSSSEVAAAFAHIADGSAEGASTKGTYSGFLQSFSAGKVSGNSVTFTSTTTFANVTDITVSAGTTVTGGQSAVVPAVYTPDNKQGAAGGGIVFDGTGSFTKSGTLNIVAGGPSTVTTATFTLDDGQIINLNTNNAVQITDGAVTIDKTALVGAGVDILSGGNVLLSQFASDGSTAAFASGDVVGLKVSRGLSGLDPMYANDVIINGIPIGAASLLADTVSPQSGNQIASAIAKAAAINEQTFATGVHATVNPCVMTGAAMGGSGVAKGSLNINGFTTPMIKTVLNNPQESRIAAVQAINFISAQTGVHAIDSFNNNKGITLVANDGRNIEVTFNTTSTNTDFSRLTGLKQGVQTGTFSLESATETPINITTSPNGDIHRAGLETVSYNSKTLSTITTQARAQANTADDVVSLGSNELLINGVTIRAALPTDDTLSVTQSFTSKAQASAIATAAAINASTAKTGVTAVPVPVQIKGNVTDVSLPNAKTLAAAPNSMQSLYINGKNISIRMSSNQTESDRRKAVVEAIQTYAGLTGVDAVDNGNDGVTLKALDGRNVSIWFDSNKVNAGSFGLGSGTASHTPDGITAIAGGSINTTGAATVYASVSLQSEKAINIESASNVVGKVNSSTQLTGAVAQIAQIDIASTPQELTVTQTSTYIQIADGGTSTESLVMSTDSTPSTTQDALSYVNGILYKGNGTTADVLGYVDTTFNGLNGSPLRFNFINPDTQNYNPVNNHYYEVITSSSLITWAQAKTLAQSRTMFGLSGYLATVTSASEQSLISQKLGGIRGWIGASDQDVSMGGLGEGNWAWMTGPEAGTMFFQGQGTTGVAINSQYNNWQTGEPNNSGGNEDYAYIASTQYWVDAPTTGTMYKYVVEYGGTGFGGNLDLSISATDIQNFKNKVTYSNSAIADTASVTINGLNITSAPTDRNATMLATALETAINDQINSGALKNVEVVRLGSKLSINSTVAGTPFQLTSVSTSNTANTISASEITGNQVATSSTDNLNVKSNFSHLGFYEGTFGGLVNEATSKISPPRTGRMTFQIGANEGNKITIDLADFGKAGPITGDITWDADMDPLASGAEIPSAQPGGPQIQGKPLTRNFIGSRSAAQEVLKKLDLVADKINQTRASLGAVMNRLDHVINNLTNFSMNLSASRSQIADADYAAASTDMAKFQIKQQAATAVLAQANTISQKSVFKLLQG